MPITDNLGLTVTPRETNASFLEWRLMQDGPDNSNMIKLDAAWGEMNTKTDAALAAVGHANTAATKAAMTDAGKIYVYVGDGTGADTGMVNGNWYYYDGTAWVSGGVYNATALDTDETLSIAGEAADAKAAGDRLTDINNTIDTELHREAADSDDKWKNGSVVTSSGEISTTNKDYRIYHGYIDLSEGIVGIEIAAGYQYEIFAYAKSNDSYIGIWNGTGFEKSASWITGETDMHMFSRDYKYRLMVSNTNTSAEITPAEGANLSFVRTVIADMQKDISDLSSAAEQSFRDITACERVPMTEGYFIDLFNSTADVTAPEPYTGRPTRYGVAECAEGDVFTVSAEGSVYPQAWGFVDSEGNVLERSGPSKTVNELVKVAPADSAYFVTNDLSFTLQSYKGRLTKNEIGDLQYDASKTAYAIEKIYDELYETRQTVLSDWAQGNIVTSTGVNSSSNPQNFLRTDFLNRSVKGIKCAAGYQYAIFAYTAANLNIYVGIWNGSGGFPKERTYLTGTTALANLGHPEYYYRLVVVNSGISSIAQSEGAANVSFMYDVSRSDTVDVLTGKKWVACGDSYTAGDFDNAPADNWHLTDGLYAGQKRVYPYIIGNRTQMVVVNEAIGGSTLAYRDGASNCFSDQRYLNIPSDADYITIKFGINDGNKGVPIGSISDSTNTTFYGAWNVVLDYLIRNHPQAKIGIIVTNASNIDIVNATIAAATKWGIPYLNEATDPQCSYMFRSLRTDVDSSIKDFRNGLWSVSTTPGSLNTHPNADAHEFESTVVEHWLRSL